MVRTDHILFICSGAFHLSKPSDLLPELQGRLPIRVELKALTHEDFVKILTEPEANLIEQYVALMKTENFDLEFEPEAIEKIADMENIQPAEEEIDSQLQEVADANNLSLEDVKLRIPMDDFITDLRVTKAIEFVKENAVVDNTISTEKEKSEDEAAE